MVYGGRDLILEGRLSDCVWLCYLLWTQNFLFESSKHSNHMLSKFSCDCCMSCRSELTELHVTAC